MKNAEKVIMFNPYMRLKDWVELINKLYDEYGDDSLLFTEAGHNDVLLILRNINNEILQCSNEKS